MEWNAQSAGLLARMDCSLCRGSGLSPASGVPCGCVCRRVFRICYRRFRACAGADSFARLVTFDEFARGVDRHLMWLRRNEDYCADFQSAGRRALAPELFRVFRFYHLLGAAPALVARRIGVAHTGLYRMIAEVEEAVGRELALMQPYSLYPPHAYLRSGQPARAA